MPHARELWDRVNALVEKQGWEVGEQLDLYEDFVDTLGPEGVARLLRFLECYIEASEDWDSTPRKE